MTRAHKPENQNPNGLHDLGQMFPNSKGVNPYTGAPYEHCDRCGCALDTHSYKIDGETICQPCLDRDPLFFSHCEG